jgi:hypothetical protein
MPDRCQRRSERWHRVGIEGILLVLDGTADAGVRPSGEALGHDAPHAGRARSGEQGVRSLGEQPVREHEIPGPAPRAGQFRERGRFVDDDLGSGAPHGRHHRISVEEVDDGGLDAGGSQFIALLCGPRRPNDLVPVPDEQDHEPSADDSACSRHKDPHARREARRSTKVSTDELWRHLIACPLNGYRSTRRDDRDVSHPVSAAPAAE